MGSGPPSPFPPVPQPGTSMRCWVQHHGDPHTPRCQDRCPHGGFRGTAGCACHPTLVLTEPSSTQGIPSTGKPSHPWPSPHISPGMGATFWVCPKPIPGCTHTDDDARHFLIGHLGVSERLDVEGSHTQRGSGRAQESHSQQGQHQGHSPHPAGRDAKPQGCSDGS